VWKKGSQETWSLKKWFSVWGGGGGGQRKRRSEPDRKKNWEPRKDHMVEKTKGKKEFRGGRPKHPKTESKIKQGKKLLVQQVKKGGNTSKGGGSWYSRKKSVGGHPRAKKNPEGGGIRGKKGGRGCLRRTGGSICVHLCSCSLKGGSKGQAKNGTVRQEHEQADAER